MFSLACKDLGVDCDYVAVAASIPAVKQDILAHSRLAHPELMKAMDEQQRAEFSHLTDAKIKVVQASD